MDEKFIEISFAFLVKNFSNLFPTRDLSYKTFHESFLIWGDIIDNLDPFTMNKYRWNRRDRSSGNFL